MKNIIKSAIKKVPFRGFMWLSFLLIMFAFMACNNLIDEKENPYSGETKEFSVKLVYPSGFENELKSGVTVSITELNLGYAYTAKTDANGVAKFTVQNGIYRVSSSEKSALAGTINVFNGTVDNVKIVGVNAESMDLNLVYSRSGQIIIKEIYSGGCTRKPVAATAYQVDKYVILYNNSNDVAYLDSLCFATVDPYNSTATNPWNLTGKIPLADVVWQFPGNGTDHPLQPGEQAVVAVNGAIDHAAQFPESVNLNNADYFVCYNATLFNNTTYHPAPGDKIRADHILDVLIKTGVANAYTFSMNSPGALIFNVPLEQGSARDFANNANNIQQKPGTSSRSVVLPNDWVLDAVEVFNGASASNKKRLPTSLDAGSVYLSATGLRHTLYRNVDLDATTAIAGNADKLVYNYTLGTDPNGVDAEASIKNGARIIYMDTNNSTNDFHERAQQSLSN